MKKNLEIQDKKRLFSLFFNIIKKDISFHIPNSEKFKYLTKIIKKFYYEHLKKKENKIFLPSIGNFILHFFNMGKITSYDCLTDPNDFIAMTIYSRLKKKTKVADMGANIGLHSIIFGKLGCIVRAYEPDSMHFTELLKNIKTNKLKNIKLIKKAVDTKEHKVKFTRVIDNTTASFISNAKKPYGKVKQFEVFTEKFETILNWASFIKMDVEGHEAKLINKINNKNLKNKTILVEVGSKTNAKQIYEASKKNKFDILCQKKSWLRATNNKDMPTCLGEGVIIIVERGRKFQNIFQ